MNGLKLAYPRLIDYDVPGNRSFGTCPPDVPAHLQQYCVQINESRQGLLGLGVAEGLGSPLADVDRQSFQNGNPVGDFFATRIDV